MKKYFENKAGFTLIEMLIVNTILGILAAVIIPQITITTGEAKLNTLKTNLNSLRSTIEVYYVQHKNKYPGAVKTTGTEAATENDAEAATAFKDQLTLFTESTGKTDADKSALTNPLGPYIKAPFPNNPYTDTGTVTADFDDDVIGAKVADTLSAWKFFPVTGVLIANDHVDHDDL